MAIIKQYDKRTDNTYIYESVSWWDKEKKRSRAKRTLIGKVDKNTGETVPTDGRHRKKKTFNDPKSEEALTVERKFAGATFLLSRISQNIGLTEDLKKCFGDISEQILSVAYFMIIERSNAITDFEKFNALHFHPYGKNISSQRGSELFSGIEEKAINHFFKLQSKRRSLDEYWVYDTTSISSYSESLCQVKYGHNKENDDLPQINLALVFGEKSNLPFYYRKLAGNIPDVKTYETLTDNMSEIGITEAKFVTDKGFASEKNIDMLYAKNHKFLMSVKLGTKYIKAALDSVYGDFRSFDCYDETTELYSKTATVVRKSGDKILIHYYYNIERAAEQEKRFNRKLAQYKNELLTNNCVTENQKKYNKYFVFARDENGLVTTVSVNQAVVSEAMKYYGFFALATNDIEDSRTALQIYRNKDVAEKAFGNIKENLNTRRTLVSSEQSLDGKLFVTFISLILLSHIKKIMQDNDLFKNYTLKSFINTFDVIECFKLKDNSFRLGEVLDKQSTLFALFDVFVNSSLCFSGI